MVIRIDFKAIIAILAILLALFVAWSIVDYLNYTTYQIIAENSVTGLVEDTPVEFNGVVVGRVSEITFNKANPLQIKILLRIKNTTPITKGTVASFDISELITEKLTGFPYVFVDLRDKGDDLQPLTAKPDGKSYPTIPMSSEHPENGKVLPALVKMSQSMQNTNKLLTPLFAEENIESLKQLIYSLQQVANVLAANSERLDTILVNTASASKSIQPLFESGADTMLMLRSQTLPQLNNLTTNLSATLGLMKRLIEKMTQNPSIVIRGEAMPRLGPGETVPRH